MTLNRALSRLGACPAAKAWAQGKTARVAWETCEQPAWLFWVTARTGASRQQIVLAACACVRLALVYVERGEEGPRKAIEAAEAWTRGEATVGEVREARRTAAAVYAASGAANAAAYAADAATTAATTAAAAVTPPPPPPRRRLAAYAVDAAAYAAYAAAYAADDAAYAAARRKMRIACCDAIRRVIPLKELKRSVNARRRKIAALAPLNPLAENSCK